MRTPPVWYALRCTGLLGAVPPVIVGVLVPALLVAVRLGGNQAVIALYTEACVTLIAPILAAWWPTFVFRERLLGPGRETLYYLRPRGEGGTWAWLTAGYVLLLVPLVVAGSGLPEFWPPGIALLVARCVFVSALAFATCFTTGSIALALVIPLLFNALAMSGLELSAESVAAVTGTLPAAVSSAGYLAAAWALVALGADRSRRFSG